MATLETIAAIATATGRAGIGIMRLSGPLSSVIAEQICRRKPQARTAIHANFHDTDSAVLDNGIALFFPSPHSYTGEDVIELHAHGSPIVLAQLLEQCLLYGARMARPGEFTERAFLNNKLDLAQAESVIDLIEARSAAAARAAVRSLEGEFSQRAGTLLERLIAVRVYIEAALDFSEEEVDFLATEELREKVVQLKSLLGETVQAAEQGRLLRDGVTIVIAGAPNVGKSSLLNQLSGNDTAIITDIAGTTRDVLREYIQIDGLPVTIIDTAGLRESNDPVEREGIKRAYAEIARADRILYIVEAGVEPVLDSLNIEEIPTDLIFNKIDLIQHSAGIIGSDDCARIYLSAKTGEGIDLLKQHIKKVCGFTEAGESTFIARQRHIDALNRVGVHVENGLLKLAEKSYPELAAEEFLLAQNALGEITGEFSNEDLLGEIFSSFCIGK